MPVYHLQNVLNGGEISPIMRGRVDQPRYQTGVRLMQNMVPMPQGGATRRPGTRFRGYALSAKSWFIRFVFNATQGRVLEFGGGKLRIWLPDGRAVITQFDTPYADADLPDLHYVQSADVVYFAHPDYAPRKLSRHADNDWRWTQLTFVPEIAAPTGLAAAIVERETQSGSTRSYTYVVTAVGADGTLDLTIPASSVLIGLPATAKITVNQPEVSGQKGSSVLKSRKVTGARLRVYRSMSFKYGFGDKLFPAVDRKVTDGTFSASPFYTEGTDIHVESCSGWQDTTPLTIAADTPTPLTILAILTAMDVAPFSGTGG